MAVTEEKLARILAPLIKRVIELENRQESDTTQERDNIQVVNDLGQVRSVAINTVIVTTATPGIHVFTANGLVTIV